MIRVAATPDAFCFMAAHCALVIIDMQRDFIEPGGFGSALGNNVAPLREIIPAVERLLLLARRHAIQVIHTRESHLPDLSDCPPAKDATESYFPAFKQATLAMIVAQGGIVGRTASLAALESALNTQ